VTQPGAKRNDRVVGMDSHFVLVPSPAGPALTSMAMPFDGALSAELCPSVFLDDQPAAAVGSKATNTVPHVAVTGSFARPPSNEATVRQGSSTVLFDDRPAARNGDPAVTCNDPADAQRGTVVAAGSVLVG
jgi:uncharacterized Zn-binding protein involved in type VI secretion